MYKLWIKTPLLSEFVMVGKSSLFEKVANLGFLMPLGCKIYIENKDGVKFDLDGKII